MDGRNQQALGAAGLSLGSMSLSGVEHGLVGQPVVRDGGRDLPSPGLDLKSRVSPCVSQSFSLAPFRKLRLPNEGWGAGPVAVQPSC